MDDLAGLRPQWTCLRACRVGLTGTLWESPPVAGLRETARQSAQPPLILTP